MGGDLAVSNITGGYSTRSGSLNMSNESDYVLVNGNVTVQSNAGSTLTAGILEIKGNFSQSTFLYTDYESTYTYGASGFRASELIKLCSQVLQIRLSAL